MGSLLDFSPTADGGGEEEDFCVGVYRTRDSISNFRLRVRVRRVPVSAPSSVTAAAGTAAAAAAAAATGSSESVRSSSVDDAAATAAGHAAAPGGEGAMLDEIVVAWQQKIFSEREFQLYVNQKESDFDNDVLGKKLFHEVKGMSKKGERPPAHKLYTSLDGELFRIADEDDSAERTMGYVPVTTNPREEPNFLAQMMSSSLVRRRLRHLPPESGGGGGAGAGQQGQAYLDVTDVTTIPTTNVVTEETSREAQLRKHLLSSPQQMMAVRLSLSEDERPPPPPDNRPAKDYLDVCVLKYGANGVLEVSPDFTRSGKPYRIEVSPGFAYEYWLEHLSPPMVYDAQLQEVLVTNDVCARAARERAARVGDRFEMPPRRRFRLLANGELVSARDFDYDGLFVHYFVELPLGWSATADSQLMGMTQRCFTAAEPRTGADVAHFSHTFSVDLLFDIDRFDLQQESLPKWPQIFLEVSSVDSWSRVRAEGYGFTSIPYDAGCHDLTVHTWRPLQPGGTGEMRRYFVGGTPELDDLAYAGTLGDVADQKILSRFGFRTAGSGSVRLRLNVLHQSEAFLTEKTLRRPMMSLVDKLGTATLFTSVSTVLEAFQKAREKMARATEGYDLNLAKDNVEKEK